MEMGDLAVSWIGHHRGGEQRRGLVVGERPLGAVKHFVELLLSEEGQALV